MKGFILAVLLMFVVTGVGMCQSLVTQNAGRDGDTYVVWVGTTPYEAIDNAYAGTYTGYTLKCRAGTAWFDFDSTVSTWNASANTFDINGQKTGENWKISATEWITVEGMLGQSLYIVSDLGTGATVQIMLNSLY